MSFLTPSADVLYGTCSIERDSNDAMNSYGEYLQEWSAVASNVRCAVQVSTGREYVRGGSVVRYDYMAYIRYDDVTPKRGDRITNYTVDGNADGKTYEILSVMDGAGKRHHWECGCREIEI